MIRKKLSVLILGLITQQSVLYARQESLLGKISVETQKNYLGIFAAISAGESSKFNSDDMILIDEKGKKIDLSELKGKVVFINFWATWCRPCVEEMPTLNKLKNKFKGNDQIIFAFVNVEADLVKSKKFMKDKNYELPVYIAADTIPSRFFQGAIPTTLIFNKKGELEAQIQGGRDFDQPQIYNALKTLTEQ